MVHHYLAPCQSHRHVILSSLAAYTVEHHDVRGNSVTFATLLGIAYGLLHIVGPDHLGTLISLSAAAAPRKAFFVGAAWSLGHCAGMVFVAIVAVVLEKATHVDVEAWEHIGDYVIGISMVLCGAYFVLREDQYLQEDADGGVSLRACACHGAGGHHGTHEHSHENTQPLPDTAVTAPRRLGCPTRQRKGKSRLRACSSYGAGCGPGSNDLSCGSECCASTGESSSDGAEQTQESSSLPPPATGMVLDSKVPPAKADVELGTPQRRLLAAEGGNQSTNFSGASLTSAMIGILQGLCCPMGMVGVAFLTTLPAHGIALFLITFLLVSALGTGLVASGWAILMRTQALSGFSTKVLYRASCGFTFTLGATWIIANYIGVLDKLNYAEHGHAHVERALGA
mmetsp:Transcript_84221/g.212361  ORF Transcript_84221/g.212361 Transcript_84221/m.212361 type:complete len:397 (+) Transcript_84221:57-1247(+)